MKLNLQPYFSTINVAIKDILLYAIQYNWNKHKFTIIENFSPNKLNCEIKLDYCPSNIARVKFLETKYKKKEKESYTRLNGYWCRNPFKSNQQSFLFLLSAIFINLNLNIY
ncbi:LOW QUALITY PROTEIN: hypothetical protein HZS_2907 [Henneguya salminicola]|nr:LOW QUALITY PROTEIN: hypothetical protein HZS_2907 [Henneguya salminicola]